MGKLLVDEQERDFLIGDIVRFADGDIHRLINDGTEEFVYASVTTQSIIMVIHIGENYYEQRFSVKFF